MSISDLFNKNNFELYINDVIITDTLTVEGDTKLNNTEVLTDLLVDGDLTVLGQIKGDVPPGRVVPGLANQFLRTNNSATAATWQSFTPSMIPVGTESQVLTTVSGVASWANPGGAKGDKGNTGNTGDKGDMGDKGNKGDAGGGGGSAMAPTVLGTAYGFQDPSNINAFGYNNDSQILGNTIGQDIPNTLTGNYSNVIAAPGSLAGTNAITNSNVFVAGNNSETPVVNRSNLIGQNFKNGATNYSQSLYLGDMYDTFPADNSFCVNTYTGGQTVTMAANSAYIGNATNNITLNSGECHIDFGAPDLFYRDLTQATNSDLLCYDNTTGQITRQALTTLIENPTVIEYQTPDLSTGTGNVITQINAGDVVQSSLVTCNPSILQLFSDGLIQLTSNDIELPLLPNVSKPNVVYYDTSSSKLSYDVVQLGAKSLGFNITTTSVVGTTGTLQNINVAANSFSGTTGDAMRFVANGTINNTGGSVSNSILFQVNGGTIATFTFNSTATSTGFYELTGEFITWQYSAPNASWYYNIKFVYTDNSGATITKVTTGSTATNITSTISMTTRASPAGANTTITQNGYKIWKE
jgi:hypothetical protein